VSAPLPEVSVVMGVRDGAAALPATLASVLAQEGIALELVVVDDGSADATPELLAAAAARDPRVRVLRQEPAGLTAALIRGCAAARAPLVARQDAGDLSLPGRLRRQIAALDAHPQVVLVSCWSEIVAPEGELLRSERSEPPYDAPRPMFAGGGGREWAGPTAHGSAIFRRDACEAAGGYRAEFALGQDWDLWLRLGERGDFLTVGEALYRRRLDPESLSLRHRRLQHEFGEASSRASRLRRSGASEAPALARARQLAARFAAETPRTSSRASAAGWYHVGEALRRAGYASAPRYLGEAVRRNPLFLRAWIRWLQALLLPRRPAEAVR
jgi:glycosyltransferase involved in cell wall biosynthesis